MIFSGWFGHIQRLVGRDVRGGLRQSMWYRRGQKSHWMSAPTRQLLKKARGKTVLQGSCANHHITRNFSLELTSSSFIDFPMNSTEHIPLLIISILTNSAYRNVSCITRTFFHPKFTQKWGVRVIHIGPNFYPVFFQDIFSYLQLH